MRSSRTSISTGNAYTTGNASALIANDGTISINAQADAFASDNGFAHAVANAHDVVSQHAYASSGDAHASITGAGSIDIGATATADAASFIRGTGATATTVDGGFAQATGYISNAVVQSAYASGGGDAVANIEQTGAIDIHANAKATGAFAVANAELDDGIDQDATTYGGRRRQRDDFIDGGRRSRRHGQCRRNDGQRLCLCEHLGRNLAAW